MPDRRHPPLLVVPCASAPGDELIVEELGHRLEVSVADEKGTATMVLSSAGEAELRDLLNMRALAREVVPMVRRPRRRRFSLVRPVPGGAA